MHLIPLMYFYFHLHVSAGNPTIFMMTFLLQEYIVVHVGENITVKIHEWN